jgi:hypothetical protein
LRIALSSTGWRPRDWAILSVANGILLLVGISFLAERVSEDRARGFVLGAVAKSSRVLLNGRPVDDPTVLLEALRQIKHVTAHHSSPTVPVQLELQAGSEATGVIIARDSKRPNEFWVYRPGSNWHGDPLGQNAGRIASTDLDNFLRQEGL